MQGGSSTGNWGDKKYPPQHIHNCLLLSVVHDQAGVSNDLAIAVKLLLVLYNVTSGVCTIVWLPRLPMTILKNYDNDIGQLGKQQLQSRALSDGLKGKNVTLLFDVSILSPTHHQG